MGEVGERKPGLESITNKRLTWLDVREPTRANMEDIGRKLSVS